MRVLWLLILSSIASAPTLHGAEFHYRGGWKTTNRKLDSTMTCYVGPVAHELWTGRFFGTWQGVDFDYSVSFVGPIDNLSGTATIDGAKYLWRARMTRRTLRANFDGDRYTGSFELDRIADGTVPSAPPRKSEGK